MSETLEERLRRDARDNCVVRAHVYARDVVKLLDARDKIIAEQRAVIAELNEAHDAQNEVLRKMWAELDALRFTHGVAVYALETIQHYNRVHNDLEAYLYDLAEWGMGKTDTKPDPGSYGLVPVDWSKKE